jgi:hypothetical protein
VAIDSACPRVNKVPQRITDKGNGISLPIIWSIFDKKPLPIPVGDLNLPGNANVYPMFASSIEIINLCERGPKKLSRRKKRDFSNNESIEVLDCLPVKEFNKAINPLPPFS